MPAVENKSIKLEKLYTRIQKDPSYRTEAMGLVFVPGMGSHRGHPVVFVGEAPGSEEEIRGEPFVGPAGRNFHALLEEAHLNRDEVFVTNLIKYRPVRAGGTNRSPGEKERRRARPFLMEELEILQPCLIVCLGLSAAKTLLQKTDLKMGDANGSLFFMDPWKILVTYHPSPHNWASAQKKAALLGAFRQLGTMLNELKAASNLS